MTSTQVDWVNEGAITPAPDGAETASGPDAVPGTIWDGERARARIAFLVNAFLGVLVVSAVLGVADSAWVLATGSRALAAPSFALASLAVSLGLAAVVAAGLCSWLPRGLFCGLALLPLASVSLGILLWSEEMPSLADVVFWPAGLAGLSLALQTLQLTVVLLAAAHLRRRGAAPRLWLGAECLAAGAPARRSVWQILADTEQRYGSYFSRALAIVLVPTLLLATVMVVSATLAGITIPNPYADMSDGELLVVGVLVAPVFETLFLWFLLVVAQWCVGGRVYASAALAALLVAFAPLWGSSLYQVVGVLWPFFVQGLVFLAWRQRARWKAVAMVTAIHAGHNALMIVPGVLLK